MTPPCRCLLGDFPEGKELAELIADYVASLPEEFRAAPEEISRRLNVCRDCAELFDGTCRPQIVILFFVQQQGPLRQGGDGLSGGAAEVGSGSSIHRAFPPNLTGGICRCSFQLLHPAVFPAGFCFALPHAKKH